MRVAVDPVLLACCAVEVGTALHMVEAHEDIEWVLDGSERDVTIIVLAGTITHAARPQVEARIAAAPAPKAVVAYGVCASSGGPYWDSHAVVPGWPGVDLLVPGCPPPASVLWRSLADVARGAVAHAAR